MGYIILIIIAIAIIYGIVKLLIWLLPKIAVGILFILGVGGAVGLVVGIFLGIKNYILSIHENIDNKALKIIMMIITSLFIIIILMYLIAAIYFLSSILN